MTRVITPLTTLKNSSVLYRTAFASLALALASSEAIALPTGAQVESGTISIQQPTANDLVVNQGSNSAIINWQNFDILNGESTRFNQPSANAIALNRVGGGSPTQILGKLSANGKLVLVNPNGVFFGLGSTVDVGGLIASTADISSANFNAGKLHFDQTGKADASIINQGSITASDGGLVALVAPSVRNDGLIQANLGTVAIGAGSTVAIDMYGDNLYSFAVGKSSSANTTAENNGTIRAQGGKIILTANAAKDVVTNVVNNTGVLEASSAHVVGGTVILGGGSEGTVKVAGKIKASGVKGGDVKITGKDIVLSGDIDATGTNGGGNVNVGGEFQGQGSTPHAETVYADTNSIINVSALDNGNGGNAVLWSDVMTQFDGTILAQGGANGGNGGTIETSGHELNINGTADASAANGLAGNWLLDPLDITIVGANPVGNNTGCQAPGCTIKPTGAGSKVANWTIIGALQAGTNVTVTTVGTVGAGNGDITVAAPIMWHGLGGSLVLQAVRDIIVNADVKTTFIGGPLQATISLLAGRDAVINANKTVATNRSNITVTAGNNAFLNTGHIDSFTGNILVTSGNQTKLTNASIHTGRGTIDINNTGRFSSNVADSLNTDYGFGGHIFLRQSTAGSIQNAINAIGTYGTGGAKLTLPVGVWTEQIEISNGNFTLQGSGQFTQIWAPNNMVTKFTADGSVIRPVIYVHDDPNVSIKDLVVDGKGLGSLANRLVGIAYNNASGLIHGVRVTNVVKAGQANNPLYEGDGILAVADKGVKRVLTISDSNINEYQRNGVNLLGADLTFHMVDDIVRGNGVTSNIRNGVRVTANATGDITNSTILKNNIGVTASGTSGLTLTDNEIHTTNDGVNITNVSNVTLSGNDIHDNVNNGAKFDTVTNLTLANNSFTTNGTGFDGTNLTNLVVGGDTFDSNGIGFALHGTDNFTLSGEVFTNNMIGIDLDNSQNTNIVGETIDIPTGGTGIRIRNGSGGTLVYSTALNGGDIGVALDGTGSSMQFGDSNNVFTGMNYYFVLSNDAMTGDTLDASQQMFDGLFAYNFTPADLAAAEAKTIDVEDGLAIGDVFYKAFRTPPSTPVIDISALDEFQRDRRNLARRSLFSYAGRTITNNVEETPPSFQLTDINLSLLNSQTSPTSATGIANLFSNLAPAAGGNAKELAKLSPAAGGSDAQQFANLSPAAGGASLSCGNSFLGDGYAPGFSVANCSVQ